MGSTGGMVIGSAFRRALRLSGQALGDPRSNDYLPLVASLSYHPTNLDIPFKLPLKLRPPTLVPLPPPLKLPTPTSS